MDTAQSSDLRTKFISGMSHAANTVNVVTTDGQAGRIGVTVSAMSSVSADTPKPTMLVCVHHASAAAAAILENGVFCVNVLRDDQSYISDTFAGRFKDQVEDKFECAEWVVMSTGSPRVCDPLVGFDCKVQSSEKVGTHYIFMGEVQDIFEADSGSPLIYSKRAYGAAWRIEGVDSIEEGQEAVAQNLNVGCFTTFGPLYMPELIRRMVQDGSRLKFNMIEGDQRRVQESILAGQTEVALLYDRNLSDKLDVVPMIELEPYVLLPKDHVLTAQEELTVADLAKHPMILLNTSPGRDYFLDIFEDAGIKPIVAYTSISLEMVRGMVGQGLGFAVLATKPATDVCYSGHKVVARYLKTETPPSRIVMVTRKGAKLSNAATEFAKQCRDYFAQDA
jgi:flavin reductase (DIM6/NTAB) family NADH-FMN oxidoreductase RutF/DNA-binding transcriptional LysR family regulator